MWVVLLLVMVVVVVGVYSFNTATVSLFPVEIAVAGTSGAVQCFQSAFLAGWHELSAAINGVAADANGMVLKTLPVPSWRFS